jgi:hypothetical protein
MFDSNLVQNNLFYQTRESSIVSETQHLVFALGVDLRTGEINTTQTCLFVTDLSMSDVCSIDALNLRIAEAPNTQINAVKNILPPFRFSCRSRPSCEK